MAFDHQNSISAFIQLLEEQPGLFSEHEKGLKGLDESLTKQVSETVETWCKEAHPKIFRAYLDNLKILCREAEDSRGIGNTSPKKKKTQKSGDPVIRLFNILRRSSPPRDPGRPKE
jgi:hypothetical protein